MAEAAAAAETKKGSGLIGLVAALVVVSGLATGGGWFLGNLMVPDAAESVAVDPKAKEAAEQKVGELSGDESDVEPAVEDSEGDEGGFSLWQAGNTVRLEPILSNLSDGSQWVRIEIGVVMAKGESLPGEAERFEITENVIALLRQSDLSDFSGPSRFLQFREDLNDTVMLSTDGRAQRARILSLVVE